MLSPFRQLREVSAVLAAAATLALSAARGGVLDRIQIVGTEFRTAAGRPVWLNGINSAWIRWNDFGGGRFDPVLWDAEFRRYAAAGINCARVWLDCDGEIAVSFDPDGFVTGPADGFIDDVAALLDIAGRYQVRVLAVLMSFDHFKPTHPKHGEWRRILNEDDRRESYLRNFLEPLARRFADDPVLLAWEICNEPEWIWFRRLGVSQRRVVAFHAHAAAALHRAGAHLVTTGSASWRWHRDRSRDQHPWSDASLAAHCVDPGARLDFFQVHYYDWMAILGWNPFDRGATPGRFLRVVDRPVIIGETRGRHSWWTGRSVAQTYEGGVVNGYAGVFGWSAHGADGHGNFDEIAMATRRMASQLPALTRPDARAEHHIVSVDRADDAPVVDEHPIETMLVAQAVEPASEDAAVASETTETPDGLVLDETI